MQNKSTFTRPLTLVLVSMLLLCFACGQTTTPKPTATQQAPAQEIQFNIGDGREMEGNMYLTGAPIVKDQVSYYFMGLQMNNTRPGNLGDTELFMHLMDETNVKIDWDLIPQASWTEKKNLTIASGEYPDAFYGPKSLSHDEVQKYGADGVLIDIEGLLTNMHQISMQSEKNIHNMMGL